MQMVRWALSVVIVGFVGCEPVFAGVAPLPRVEPAEVGLDKIRVRIFPHKRDFAPHFRDSNWRYFSLRSKGVCRVYAADSYGGIYRERILATTRALRINSWQLEHPISVRCSEPVELQRPHGQPSWHYTGDIVIRRVFDKRKKIYHLQAVNYVNLEEYLRGVVPSEVSASWPEETLKSQAVAARTYALFHMSYERERRRYDGWDVDDTVVFQAYTGVDRRHPRTDAAIAATNGQVLLSQQKLFPTFYHADSGGMTASAGQVFRQSGSMYQMKREPYSGKYAPKRWTTRLSAAEVSKKLSQLRIVSHENPVSNLSIPLDSRSPSGRVKRIDVTLSDGQLVSVPVARFKRAVNLNSALFDVSSHAGDDRSVVFEFVGRGSGHGVGLNQTGAKILARHYGWSYEQILGFYYADTTMCRLPEEGREADTCRDVLPLRG